MPRTNTPLTTEEATAFQQSIKPFLLSQDDLEPVLKDIDTAYKRQELTEEDFGTLTGIAGVCISIDQLLKIRTWLTEISQDESKSEADLWIEISETFLLPR